MSGPTRQRPRVVHTRTGLPRGRTRIARRRVAGRSLFAAALLGLALGPTARADEPAPRDINQRLYEQLEHGPSGDRIQTVSGQMYIGEADLDRSVINDALAAMLDASARADTSVAVRRAPRLNFEIHFQKNSAELTPEARRGLDELGEVLSSEYLDTRFVLGGHTDQDGDPALNEPLSQARADSARAYLVERHRIAADRLVARGYGESDPLREIERTPQDKLYNRRVDLRPMREEAP